MVMLVKFNMKDSQIPEKTLEQMEKKLQARFHRYLLPFEYALLRRKRR